MEDAAPAAAARILAAVLAVLLLLRLVGAAMPPGWAWGIGLWRFLPGWMVAGGVALMGSALLAPVSGRIAARLWRDERPFSWRFGAALAVALGLLAWLMPDRLHFTGDCDKRQAAFTRVADAAKLFPQALPADLALHHSFPRWLQASIGLTPEVTTRLFGIAEGMAMGLAAWAFARALGIGGAPGFAATMTVAFGGWLALFGGYLKPFSEYAPLAAIAGASLIAVARRGRGLGTLGVVTAAALVLHRAGLAMLGGFASGWLVALTARRREVGWRSPGPWIGVVAVAAALALALPRVIALSEFDVRNLAPAEVQRHGVLAAAVAPLRLVDLANVFLLFAPLALAIPFLAMALGGSRLRRLELAALAGFALPLLGLAAVFHPEQGIFRDWDPFTAAGVALAMLAAALAAESLRGATHRAWLAPALAVSLAVPSLQWGWLQSDVDRGLARAEAIAAGPPRRSGDVVAITMDWAGMRRLGLDQPAAAANCFRRAVEAAPNPRYFIQWGMAETLRGDAAAAQRAYAQATTLDPRQLLAWKGLAASSSALGDSAGMARAAAALERLAPGDPMTRDARAWLEARREPAAP